MSSYQYRKSQCGDKTILRPSYLHNGISYTGKTTSLYWIGALCIYQSFLRPPWLRIMVWVLFFHPMHLAPGCQAFSSEFCFLFGIGHVFHLWYSITFFLFKWTQGPIRVIGYIIKIRTLYWLSLNLKVSVGWFDVFTNPLVLLPTHAPYASASEALHDLLLSYNSQILSVSIRKEIMYSNLNYNYIFVNI